MGVRALIVGQNSMLREKIDEVVCEIMRSSGPDGHIDGHQILTDFICAVRDSKGHEWVTKYRS